MAKTITRVYLLAKELGVASKAILTKCDAEGMELKGGLMTPLTAGQATTIREWFSEGQHITMVETSGPVDLEKVRVRKKTTPPVQEVRPEAPIPPVLDVEAVDASIPQPPKRTLTRVYLLAKELGVNSKAILTKCDAEGMELKGGHMTPLTAGQQSTIREWFSEGRHATAVETSGPVDLEKARVRNKNVESIENYAKAGDSQPLKYNKKYASTERVYSVERLSSILGVSSDLILSKCKENNIPAHLLSFNPAMAEEIVSWFIYKVPIKPQWIEYQNYPQINNNLKMLSIHNEDIISLLSKEDYQIARNVYDIANNLGAELDRLCESLSLNPSYSYLQESAISKYCNQVPMLDISKCVRTEFVHKIADLIMINKNVLLIGDTGIGKKNICQYVSKIVSQNMIGKKGVYKRIIQPDYSRLHSSDSGYYQSVLSIIKDMVHYNNCIFNLCDLHLSLSLKESASVWYNALCILLEYGIPILATTTINGYENLKTIAPGYTDNSVCINVPELSRQDIMFVISDLISHNRNNRYDIYFVDHLMDAGEKWRKYCDFKDPGFMVNFLSCLTEYFQVMSSENKTGLFYKNRINDLKNQYDFFCKKGEYRKARDVFRDCEKLSKYLDNGSFLKRVPDFVVNKLKSNVIPIYFIDYYLEMCDVNKD